MTTPDPIEQKLSRELDQSIDTLPSETLQKLAAARNMALQANRLPEETKPLGFRWPFTFNFSWHRVAYAGAFSLMILIITLLPYSQTNKHASSNYEMLLLSQFAEMTDEEAELVNDLQFAIWLLDHDLDSNPG